MKKPKTKENFFDDIINVLKEIKKLQPNTRLASHLSVIIEDYGDIWGISDKELLFALTKYKAQMMMDIPHEADDKEIQKIIEDAKHLTSFNEEDEDY